MMERAEAFDVALDAALGGERGLEFAELLAYVDDLRMLPRPEFQEKLWEELKAMRTTMAQAYKRPGFGTVTPYVAMKNAAEVAKFLQEAFGAEITDETEVPSGGRHRELRMSGSMLMLGESVTMPTAIHLFVDDVDATFARAMAAGARLLMGDQGKPADRPYGERSAFIEDPGGNTWYIAKQLGQSGPAPQTIVPYLHPRDAAALIDFLKAVFGAEELGRYNDGDRVMHAAVKIGGSTVEMGEGAEPKTQGLYVYLEDPDAAYDRALANGATSLYAPADHFYGERSGGFTDPEGNAWYVARVL
ncbi:MAG: VOC family protein [Acidobacteriota bacterium]